MGRRAGARTRRSTITDLAFDSRDVRPGRSSSASRALSADGHDFAAEAVAARRRRARRRARRSTLAVPQLVVPDARAAMAPAADAFFGYPTRELDGRRGHRHERQDDDRFPALLDPRRRRPAARAAGHDRVPGRRRAAGRRPARRRRRSTCSERSARCSTPATGAARWRRPRTPSALAPARRASASPRSSSRT